MLIAALLTLFAQTLDPNSTFLADGTRLSRPGLPGTICVFGPQAQALLTSGDVQTQAVAARASFGKGRVFAIAHNGYFAPQFFADPAGMMRSALDWLRGDNQPGQVAFLHGGGEAMRDVLQQQGYSIVPLPATHWQSLQLLIVEGAGPMDAESLQAVQAWMQQGGTVLAAICPWGWQQIHEREGWNLIQDMAANQILAPTGLLFTDGYAAATIDDSFVVDAAACARVNCQNLITQIARGKLPSSMAPLESALRVLPPDDTLLLPQLQALLPALDANSAPTPEHPLKVRDAPLLRLAVVALDRKLSLATPEHPMIAPGALSFPGASAQGSPTSTRLVTCVATQTGWQSTGLYVDPGAVVKLAFKPGSAAGWSYRIGAHKDQLWHKDRWPRWPSISTTGAVVPEITSAFGGLLYLQKNQVDAATLKLSVAGAKAAPYWKVGQTTSARWQVIREAPAPWAELEGKYMILTVPSSAVRKLDNPAELMAWWDKVVATQHLFAGEEPPQRPERFVADVLISAGYMHSGYPVMMHLDVATQRADGKRLAALLDLEELQREGNWGCFHELGHNRQKPAWTFGGTGEVTNNLFSLYSGEIMSGIDPWENAWLQNQKQSGGKYLAAGADFAQWKRKPGVALLCYAQVQKRFGWEPFRRVFAAALDLPNAEQPNNDDEKRSFWVRAMSLAVQRDLRPFHQHWGWPLQASLWAEEELNALDPWMPDFQQLEE